MTFLARWQPQLLSLLRIVSGLLFLEHGTSKILHWPDSGMPPPPPEFLPILTAAGIIELIGGALITIGFQTRLAAFICAGEMAVAYWLGHFARGAQSGQYLPMQNGGDAAILFCFAFLYMAAAGGGAWSVDRK